MNLTEKYKASRLRNVTLSTGDVIQVRPFNRSDWIAIGDIPTVILNGTGQKVLSEGKNGERERFIEDNADFFERQMKVALGRCIVTKDFIVITDKPESECGEGELHYSLISNDDKAAILSGVMEASNSGRKEVADAATFRAQHDAAGDAGQAGAEIRRSPALVDSN